MPRHGPSPFLHCLLLSLAPGLTLYADNPDLTAVSDLAAPLAAVTGSILLLIGVGWLFRRHRDKAGLLISGFLLFSFAYAGAIEAVRGLFHLLHVHNWVTNRASCTLWCFLFLLGSLALLRFRGNLRAAVHFANIAASVLLGIVLLRIGASLVRSHGHGVSSASVSEGALLVSDRDLPALRPPPSPPDIYYLIFDRYASDASLREFDHFDNSPFTGFLRQRGFLVFDSKRTNYPLTHLSLASSLNLTLLGDDYVGIKHYRSMIRSNVVVRALQKARYRYVHLGSWWEPTRANPRADRNFNYGLFLSEFSKALLKMTPYHLFLLKDQEYHQTLYTLDKLETMPEEEGPKFVFAHLLVPHGPYVFRADGSKADVDQGAGRSEREAYLAQLQYLNSRLTCLVRTLLERSERPPIIILQADEGPYPFPGERDIAPDVRWRRRAEIMNAYYLPGPGPEPYESMTPVNTFRFLFNRYFGTRLEMQEDRVFGWPVSKPDGGLSDYSMPFRFVEITALLEGAPAAPKAESPPSSNPR